MKEDSVGRYVAPNTVRCSGPGCNNFAAEGRHDKRSKLLYCSGACWKNRNTKGTRPLICACGCGEEFLGTNSTKPGREKHYKPGHYDQYRNNKYLESFGSFRDTVVEYLEGYAKQHYTELGAIRSALGTFFTYLNEEGIQSIEHIEPKTITSYLAWAEKTGRPDAKYKVTFLSTFFKWTIAFGHRKGGNPVLPGFHGATRPKKAPRPLEAAEEDLTRQLLNDRGNAMLRLVVALGEEAGLRISELAGVRLSDIDLVGRRVFVWKGKGMGKEKPSRWAFFSSNTVTYYNEWLAERDPNCGHDFLFYNAWKKPPTDSTLRNALNKVLLKKADGGSDDVGFDAWSTHRLRHSMASNLAAAGADANVIMAQGGWKTFEAMSVYTRVDQDLARKGYDEAMRKANERKKAKPSRRSLSLNEYLIHVGKADKSLETQEVA
jgi:integrase